LTNCEIYVYIIIVGLLQLGDRMGKIRYCVKNNLFWLLFLLIACLLTVSIYFWAEESIQNSVVTKEKSTTNKGKRLVIFCFDQKLVFNCKENKEKNKGFCSDELKNTILQICEETKKAGLFPLHETMIDLNRFDECSQFEKEKAGCSPFFFIDGKIKNFDAGYIFLPASLSKNQKDFKRVLSHEVVHGLMSQKLVQAGRIIREFFAVYYEVQVFGGAGHIVCNSSSDNQPALATYDGDYVFPPTKNDHSKILSACRYGQLDHLANELISIDKNLLRALWAKLNQYKKERIGLAELKAWVGSLNSEALDILNKYYLFRENKGKAHIVIISGIQQYYIFFYQSPNPSKEKFFTSVPSRIEIFRKHKLADFLYSSSMRYVTVNYSKVKSNDTVRITARINNKIRIRKIYVP